MHVKEINNRASCRQPAK